MGEKLSELFRLLDWDSKFFGYKVGQIKASHLTPDKLKRLLDYLSNNAFRLIYWSVDPKDKISNKAAKINNGFLTDKKITYLKDLSNYLDEDMNRQHLRSYLHKPLNRHLISLALQAGLYSRFAYDKNFKHNEFTRLYTKWIERSLNGEIALDIIVYIYKNIERGLVTLESKSGYGSIGLLTVDKKYRGYGIGKQLVKAALAQFKHLGMKKVKVSTQKDNIIACQFYEKLGFVEESLQNVYHFWLK